MRRVYSLRFMRIFCEKFIGRRKVRTITIAVATIIILILAYPRGNAKSLNTKLIKMEESGQRLVHLDLKGAPPKMDYYRKLFPKLRQYGATGLLVEYEDVFPYSGSLEVLAAHNAYSLKEIETLQNLAKENDLALMPLVQTFGHFEFVLKHDRFRSLREVEQYPNALCPTNPDVPGVVFEMIRQIMSAHPDVQYLHIGSDEVWHLGLCDRCNEHMAASGFSKDQLFLEHVKSVTGFIKQKFPTVVPVMWDDMFRHTPTSVLKESKIAEFVEPMVWHYTPQLNLPEDLFSRYSEVFPNIWLASSFKGATGPAQITTNVSYHLRNHQVWLKSFRKHGHMFRNVRGFALTGWQRYDHYAVLCELLPVSIPSLVVNLHTLKFGGYTEEMHSEVSSMLGFDRPLDLFPNVESPIPKELNFPGSEVFVNIHRISRLRPKIAKFYTHNAFLAGFNPYLVRRNFTNPFGIEHWLPKARELHKQMEQLQSDLKVAMAEVYDESVYDEFFGQHLAEDFDKLTTLLHHARKQLVIGARVKKPISK